MALPSYIPGHAEAFVRQQHWPYKKTGDELVLRTCPFCGRADFRFYLNDQTGTFICHHAKCAQKGNWFQFNREFGGPQATYVKPLPRTEDRSLKQAKRWTLEDFAPFEAALASDAEGLAYLAARNLTLETAQAWHLGLKTEKDGSKWLMFPYLSATGEVYDCKYRHLKEKRFRRLGGGESVLYGEQFFSQETTRPKFLYLVEGETDCLSMWQAGFRPVVSTTTGAGSFKPRWHDLIVGLNPEYLVLVYDSDVAGQEGARNLLRKFDDRNVLNIVLPVKDANEFFQTHTTEDFDALIQDTQPVEIDRVLSMASVLDMLEEQLFLGQAGCDGYPSQFDELNDMIAGGYWKGTVSTISGMAGIGKTSFALQELLMFAKQDIPSYLLCLEMPEVMIMRKIIEHEYHLPMRQQTLHDVQRCREALEKLPLYLGYKSGAWEEIEAAIRAAVRRYDLRVLAFDNVNYFVRSSQNQAAEIGLVTKRLKQLAVELQLAILLIAQPRKFDDADRMMTINDLKDSSSIGQDSDNVMMLWRRRMQTQVKKEEISTGFVGAHSPYAILRVDKSRFSAGGEMTLYFDGAISTYRGLTLEEKQALQQLKERK